VGVLDRFRRKKKTPYAAISDEERMSRYLYLLSTLPAPVIERAHEAAFKDLPLARRQEMFEQLRPFMSEEEKQQAAEPELLARLLRRAEERRAESAAASASGGNRDTAGAGPELAAAQLLTQSGVMPLVAYHFLTSAAVYSYFTVGAGSLALAGEPGWVNDIADPSGGAGGIDGGYSGDGGGGFDSGGGFDGGGYSGFDAGGFGGGFDGGGGGFG